MDRRSYLGAVSAGLSALAGCARRVGSRTTLSPTPDPTTTSEEVPVRIETVTMKLEVPWGVAFHPETEALYYTERPGRIGRVSRNEDGELVALAREVVRDLTETVEHRGEGGLLGLVFHPSDPDIAYTYQTYADADGLGNRIVEHDVDDEFEQRRVLFDGIPAASIHDGGRLAVGPDDALYVTTGDAANPEIARNRDSLAGKVLRLTLDGEPHPDNPFDSAVFTLGHRNPQGLAFHPETGALYSTEHGPDTDDEINVLRAGDDYGWPDVRGAGGGDGVTDPIATYTPTIAPGSATFYTGPIDDWRGDLFFGSLADTHLRRVVVDADSEAVTEQFALLQGGYGRLRTAFTGPDDHLYVTTSNQDGRGNPAPQDDRILRIRPA